MTNLVMQVKHAGNKLLLGNLCHTTTLAEAGKMDMGEGIPFLSFR